MSSQLDGWKDILRYSMPTLRCSKYTLTMKEFNFAIKSKDLENGFYVKPSKKVAKGLFVRGKSRRKWSKPKEKYQGFGSNKKMVKDKVKTKKV